MRLLHTLDLVVWPRAQNPERKWERRWRRELGDGARVTSHDSIPSYALVDLGVLPVGFSLLLSTTSTLLLTILGLSRFRNRQGLPVARWHCVTVTAQAAYTGQDCNFDVNCISFRLREGSWKTNIAGILGRSPYPYRHVLSAQSVPTEPGREPKELT